MARAAAVAHVLACLMQWRLRASPAFQSFTAMSPRVLSDILDRNANSFGLVRLWAALAVVVSHAFVLASGDRFDEPVRALTGWKLGDLAVAVFFILSGIVTAASLERTASIPRFLWARALRIVPAVAVYAVVFGLLIAPVISSRPASEVLTSPDLATFLLRTLTFAPGNPALPGVFETTPLPGIVNEPLWTVKYEILCYLALAACGFLVARWGRMALLAAAGAVIALHVFTTIVVPVELTGTLQHLRHFGLCYAAGVAAYAIAERIPISGTVFAAILAASLFAFGSRAGDVALVALLGCGAIWLGSRDWGRWSAFAARTDLSYGIYVFGWPVGQMIAGALPGIGWLPLLGLNLALVIPLALLSWELVERPALSLKRSPTAPAAKHDDAEAVEASSPWSVQSPANASPRRLQRPLVPGGFR